MRRESVFVNPDAQLTVQAKLAVMKQQASMKRYEKGQRMLKDQFSRNLESDERVRRRF